MRLLSLATAALLLALGACADGTSAPRLEPIAFDAIAGWNADAADQAFAQFRRQCGRLAELGPDAHLGGTDRVAALGGTPSDEAAACTAARDVTVADAAAARRFFETWFAAFDAGRIHYGGYFEGEYRGSLAPGGAYRVPVLARPTDLVTTRAPDGSVVSGRSSGGVVVPYATRAAIDHGALAGRRLELLWLADPVDLLFLQMEGSGRIRLPSGQVVRVGYAGRNGRENVPIGRILIAHGLLAPEDASPARIRAVLEAHPDVATALIEENPSYVFFRVLPGVTLDEGAPGTLGVPLAPLRSLAVDRAAIPLGLPVFYVATDPASGRTLAHLAFAEDTGSDLTGADRADIFFGWGEAASRMADGFHATGRAILLLPRPVLARPSRGGAA